MPSKYIFLRLAQTPFLTPAASKTWLAQEFIDELDVRRQAIALSPAQEVQDSLRQVNECLTRCKTKDAKQYVWREFSHALNSNEEPHLFMAGYQWLQDNKEYAPQRKHSLLDWQDDDAFACSSLLCAATQLPAATAVTYIATWLRTRQQKLESTDNGPLLPAQKIRLDELENGFYDKSQTGYTSQTLWEYVLAPALPFLSEEYKDPFKIPYLPYFLEHSLVQSLLSAVEPKVHTWVLSNALFTGDFCPARANTAEDSDGIKSLSRFASTLTDQSEKAFTVWDMIHRRDDIRVAGYLVEHHFPPIKTLLADLGMTTIQDMRQAMLCQWHAPSKTLVALDLPTDLHANVP